RNRQGRRSRASNESLAAVGEPTPLVVAFVTLFLALLRCFNRPQCYPGDGSRGHICLADSRGGSLYLSKEVVGLALQLASCPARRPKTLDMLRLLSAFGI